jgi:hypothetical protein
VDWRTRHQVACNHINSTLPIKAPYPCTRSNSESSTFNNSNSPWVTGTLFSGTPTNSRALARLSTNPGRSGLPDIPTPSSLTFEPHSGLLDPDLAAALGRLATNPFTDGSRRLCRASCLHCGALNTFQARVSGNPQRLPISRPSPASESHSGVRSGLEGNASAEAVSQDFLVDTAGCGLGPITGRIG